MCLGIDYYGRWKALQYAMRKACAPILIAPTIDGDCVHWHIVSEVPEKVAGDLYVSVRDFRGKIVFVNRYPLTIHPSARRVFLTLTRNTLHGTASEECVVLVSRFVSRSVLLAENFLYFKDTKDLRLEHSVVTIAVKPVKDGCEITLSSATLAKNVLLRCADAAGWFSDNYFDLLPNECKIVTLKTDRVIDELAPTITAISLADIAHA